MSPVAEITVAFIALGIVNKLLDWLLSFTRGQQKQEAADAAERQRWMTMLETVLDKQQGKFAELAATFKSDLAGVVAAMQQNHIEAQADLIERMTGHMGKVTAAHTAKLDLMHADVKSVPAETVRLLQTELVAHTETVRLAVETATESHQETIREAVTQALQPYLDQLEEKLDQMPGTEATRRLMREEIEKLHQRLIDQVAEQTTPVLDKLNEIAAALDKLQPPPSPEGGEAPSDETHKDKENAVGTPS